MKIYIGVFIKMEFFFSYKVIFDKFENIEIIKRMFFNLSEIKLNINNKKIGRNFLNIWK